MIDTRYARQEALFGEEGQRKIGATAVAITGVGGNGTQVIQDLVHLGTRRFVLIEPGELKESSKNRYIGHRHDDPTPGTLKLAIAERMILSVNPDAKIVKVPHPIQSAEAQDALTNVDVVFGCLDNDGARFVLNSVCAEQDKKLIDIATEILPAEGEEPLRYGGRVFVCWERPGCLVCCDVLDREEVEWQLASSEERSNRESIYGIRAQSPDGSGPSVVTLNGVVSSIGTTEFMVAVTGLRSPIRLTTYRADTGRFTVNREEPASECYTCALAKASSG